LVARHRDHSLSVVVVVVVLLLPHALTVELRTVTTCLAALLLLVSQQSCRLPFTISPRSIPPPSLPPSLHLVFHNRFLSALASLSGWLCVNAEICSAASLHSLALSFFSFFFSLSPTALTLSLSSLHLPATASPPPPPPSHLPHVCLSSVDCDCERLPAAADLIYTPAEHARGGESVIRDDTRSRARTTSLTSHGGERGEMPDDASLPLSRVRSCRNVEREGIDWREAAINRPGLETRERVVSPCLARSCSE